MALFSLRHSRTLAAGFAALLLALASPPCSTAAEPTALAAAIPVADSPTGDAKAAADATTVTAVPLARVVLFSSGVGFFDRQGQVDGNASVGLKFNTGDINDLLKSLVVEDRGGQIAGVTYGSKDPITKTLQKFAINLTSNPTVAQILNQIRGERIEFSAPGPMSGTLLGVETRQRQLEPNTPPVAVEILNVLSDEGLRSVPMDQVGTIKLVNPQLDKEFRQALAVLAMGHDSDKKSVTLHFTGQGARPVRVGYIQNMPIWKTSYRLVLSDEGKPALQGWAIVENTTEEDWHDVDLTLVSGRPVSFIMNLYDPFYVQRPIVQPDLFAGLRPQVHRQALDRREDAKQAEPALATAAPAGMAGGGSGAGFGGRGSAKGANKHFAGIALGEVAGESLDADLNGNAPYNAKPDGSFTPTMAAAATATDVGELFQYRIGPPVSLNRQESAMLPIVNDEVGGSKLSVYNPAVQIKHPLCGLRLKNTTELHLMQGPITVFDGGAYAGDARIEDIAPGGERLVTYSLDLDVEVAAKAEGEPEEITSVRMTKGVLIAEHKATRGKKYTLKNSGKKDRTVLVEQPLDAAWRLVSPKEPTEKTAALYRFEVDVAAGKTVDFAVAEQRTYSQQVSLSNINDDMIQFFQRQRVISPEAKAALERIVEMKSKLARLSADRGRLEGQVRVITEEQNRIRQNMQQLDRNSDLYKRYVKMLGEQEDSNLTLRRQIEKATADEDREHTTLDQYLMSLDLK